MRRKWRELGFILFLPFEIALGIFKPFLPNLSPLGHWIIVSVLITTTIWILEPFGISLGVGGIAFMAMALILGVPAEDVFSGFTQSAIWTLVPALFFGVALQKTGLGTRIVYFMLRFTKVSYLSLLFVWTIIGIALSFLTPSITVRIVIITPLALECANLCGLPERSKERSLLLLTTWAMSVIPGIGWSTGTLMGPILTGIFSSVEGIPPISFADWARVSLLPAVLVTVFLFTGGYWVLRPKQKLSISKQVFQTAYRNLPRATRQEKGTAAILTLCFILFATSSWHHIPDAAVCMTGFLLLCGTGVISRQDISTGISWDLILFVGASMGFGSVFATSGVSAWLSDNLSVLLQPVAAHPWLFVYSVLIFLFIWRLLDVALLTPTIVMIAPVIPTLGAEFGIHPLVWIPLFSMAICAFFFPYESMFCLICEAEMKSRGWLGSHRFCYACIYFIACLAALLIAVPYWESIGIFQYMPA